MPEMPAILDHRADFDPAGDFEAFLRSVPAKWVVYLMSDGDGRPVQLLCVKNLRQSLKRRLGGEDPAITALSKRVDYRALVRRISWRRVDSAFEADWIYYEAARVVFPRTYSGMVGFRPAWFVHVNPDANFPRYTKTTNLSIGTGMLLGPIEDKHAAGKLLDEIESAFDLCRYYNILVEAPHGKACAYKEMGRCPAPCDGTITMPQYRQQVEWSAQTVADPDYFLRDQTARMKAAAADLKFETAAKIKGFIDAVAQFRKGPFRHLRRLEEFQYLSLQHGPRDGTAKAFVITPGGIEHAVSLIGEPDHPGSILRIALEAAAAAEGRRMGLEEEERIGIVAHHLFTAKSAHGVFLRLADVNEKAVVKAYRDLRKQKRTDESEGEGVMKELQSVGE